MIEFLIGGVVILGAFIGGFFFHLWFDSQYKTESKKPRRVREKKIKGMDILEMGDVRE